MKGPEISKGLVRNVSAYSWRTDFAKLMPRRSIGHGKDTCDYAAGSEKRNAAYEKMYVMTAHVKCVLRAWAQMLKKMHGSMKAHE